MTDDDPDGGAFRAPAVIPDVMRFPPLATAARLALGRAGSGMPTRAVLNFALDHARARDAVHAALDWDRLETGCSQFGLDVLRIESAAPDRQTYLRRPDLGRRLSPASRAQLAELLLASPDVLIVVGDGLSSTAVQNGAIPLLMALIPTLRASSLTIGPLLLARQARVALADEAGGLLGARLTLMILGERPGLSAADSLGAYLTFSPALGRTDADRNCVSNIRDGGLEHDNAASKLAWLVEKAFALGMSGVQLKDESDAARRCGSWQVAQHTIALDITLAHWNRRHFAIADRQGDAGKHSDAAGGTVGICHPALYETPRMAATRQPCAGNVLVL